MTDEQDLSEKLTRLGYQTYQIKPGIDDLPMLYISTRFICGTGYALELGDEALSSLITETLTFWGEIVQGTQVSGNIEQVQEIQLVQDAQEVEEENATTGQN